MRLVLLHSHHLAATDVVIVSFETSLRYIRESLVKRTIFSIVLVSWMSTRSPLEPKPSSPNEETTAVLSLRRRRRDSRPLRNSNIRPLLVQFLEE